MTVVARYPHFAELGLHAGESTSALSSVGTQLMRFLRDAIGRAQSDALVTARPSSGALIAAAGSAEALAKSCIVGDLTEEAAAAALFDVLVRTLH
jgi:hypothetical protein